MSEFVGRGYIADLNAIPTAEDLAAQQHDNINVEEDLSKYRIEEFFDMDMGESVTSNPVPFDSAMMDRTRRQNATAQRHTDMASGVNYLDGRCPGLVRCDRYKQPTH
jgi:hypothetical protein